MSNKRTHDTDNDTEEHKVISLSGKVLIFDLFKNGINLIIHNYSCHKLYGSTAYVLCLIWTTVRLKFSLMISCSLKFSLVISCSLQALLLVQFSELFILVQELRKFLTVLCPVLLETFYGSRLALDKLFVKLLEGFDFVFVFFNHDVGIITFKVLFYRGLLDRIIGKAFPWSAELKNP